MRVSVRILGLELLDIDITTDVTDDEHEHTGALTEIVGFTDHHADHEQGFR